MSINDGGPAYPSEAIWIGEEIKHTRHHWRRGMSLRDWFAGTITIKHETAFTEASSLLLLGEPQPDIDNEPAKWLAWVCKLEAHIRYAKADAMLAAQTLEPSDPGPWTPRTLKPLALGHGVPRDRPAARRDAVQDVKETP